MSWFGTQMGQFDYKHTTYSFFIIRKCFQLEIPSILWDVSNLEKRYFQKLSSSALLLRSFFCHLHATLKVTLSVHPAQLTQLVLLCIQPCYSLLLFSNEIFLKGSRAAAPKGNKFLLNGEILSVWLFIHSYIPLWAIQPLSLFIWLSHTIHNSKLLFFSQGRQLNCLKNGDII